MPLIREVKDICRFFYFFFFVNVNADKSCTFLFCALNKNKLLNIFHLNLAHTFSIH